jgi:glycosyltransferase involved in cell wall biosynthesis
MRISVVIATYNRAALLEATLAHLRCQQFDRGDEVVVVDNASTDNTSDVVARGQLGFPVPLHYLSEPTPGKTPALNCGIAAAAGDVLALTDDDVLVAGDWLATIRRLFADPSLALVGGRVDPLWERPAPRWLRVECDGCYKEMASPLALLHYGEAQPLGARTAVGANLVVRRAVHDAIGGFATRLGRRRGTLLCGEDHDFCQRVVAAGYRCEYRPELRVRHWVPADRARLRYFLRWFFWLGVTNAVLESNGLPAVERRLLIPQYMFRRAVRASTAALLLAAARRRAEAAARFMDAAFAAGYLRECVGPRPHAASTPPAAMSALSVRAGTASRRARPASPEQS